MTKGRVREAVGVFQDEPSLGAAVDDLIRSGFDRSDVSVVPPRRSFERQFGAMYDHVADLEDAPEAPRAGYVGNRTRTQLKAAVVGGFAYLGAVGAAQMMIASGESIAVSAMGAGIAGSVGGLIGGAVAMILDQRHADYVDQQLSRGGLLLWVQTADSGREARACEVLRRRGARNVRVCGDADAGTEIANDMSEDMVDGPRYANSAGI